MSLLPISLPLYPILNASEAVEKLLEENAEAASAWPSEEKSSGLDQAGDTAIVDAGRPANKITAVEGAAQTVDAPPARAGGETPLVSELASQEVETRTPDAGSAPAEGLRASDRYVAQSDATRAVENEPSLGGADADAGVAVEDPDDQARLDARA